MNTDPSGVGVSGWLEARLSVDGPHSDEATRDAANAFAYLARWLNHATLPERADQTLSYPSTMSAVTGAVAVALGRLPQLFDQLAARADQFADNPRLTVDELGPLAEGGSREQARLVGVYLRAAGWVLRRVDASLQEARRAASRLGLREGETR